MFQVTGEYITVDRSQKAGAFFGLQGVRRFCKLLDADSRLLIHSLQDRLRGADALLYSQFLSGSEA